MAGLVAVSAALVSYELTPAPVLGHRDPHSSGIAAAAQDALAQSDALVAQLPGSAAPPSPPSPPPAVSGGVPRRGLWLEIPELSIALPVVQGDGSDRIPMWKALVYPGTAWPGQSGNSYVYAHGYWGMFGGLLYAKPGDRAYLHDFDTGRQTQLRVTRVVGRVRYDDIRWLAARGTAPMVTLQTCVDSNPKGDRFVVQLS